MNNTMIAFRLARLWDAIAMKCAWLLPVRVVMWAAIRVGANATQGEYGGQVVPDLRFMDAMQRWPVR